MSRINQPVKRQQCPQFSHDHDDAHGNGRIAAGNTDDRGHDGSRYHGEKADEGRRATGVAALGLHRQGKAARPQSR